MRIVNASELQSELLRILAYAQSERPSRVRLANTLATLAERVAGAFGTATGPSVDSVKRHGEWNLIIRRSRPTRWDFFLENPHGGGGGSSSYTSVKAAIAAAIGRGLQDGPERVWTIVAEWNVELEDYAVVKTSWVDVPELRIPEQPKRWDPGY